MESIVFIGGTYANLTAALELAEFYDIKLIELNAEIGLPSISPGHLRKESNLSKYLTSEQMEFLQLHSFEDGFTLRSEWGLKHLAVQAAKNGVEIFTRTRITKSFESPDGFTIEYQGGGPNSNGQIICQHLINDVQWTYQAPGSKQHTLIDTEKIHVPHFGEFIEIHGGTALSKDCTEVPSKIDTFPRAEGLTEVWQTEESWIPKHGWIETISCSLPLDNDKRCIDAQISEGRRISNALK